MDVHDSYSFEFCYFVVKIFTHSSYLPVQPLCQHDPEAELVYLLSITGSCDSFKYRYPGAHFSDETFSYWFINGYHIFLFMIVSCSKDLVDDVSVICK